jgi:hypothetical protein
LTVYVVFSPRRADFISRWIMRSTYSCLVQCHGYILIRQGQNAQWVFSWNK